MVQRLTHMSRIRFIRMLCWGNFCGWTSLIRTAGSAPHIAFCVFLLRPSHRPPCTRERRSSRPCLACTPSMSIAWIGGTRRPALKSVRIGRVVPCAALRCSFRPPVLCGLPWRGGGGEQGHLSPAQGPMFLSSCIVLEGFRAAFSRTAWLSSARFFSSRQAGEYLHQRLPPFPAHD